MGLIDGVGVGATVHYYRALAKAHEAQGRTLDIIIAHAETPRVFEFVEAGDRDGLANYLLGFLRRLHAAGAEVAVVPAVTPHFCIRELVAASPVPLLNIFDPLNAELAARSVRRVAVFGTRFVIESDLYGMAPGVEIVRPQPSEIDTIHNTYVDLPARGEASAEQHRVLTALAHTLQKREEVDAIIFAGTDLSLLFNEANTDFPAIDCAALHLRAILQGLLD